MSSNALTVVDDSAMAAIEQVVCTGDLKDLTAQQKVVWYRARCEAVGLDYRTTPFQYVMLNGKMQLYATKTATEQISQARRISTRILSREVIDGVYVVTCQASMPDGVLTESTGAVSLEGLRGENKANALMKAETKAKRRAVLSLTGLGAMDETEVETIPEARLLSATAMHDPSAAQRPAETRPAAQPRPAATVKPAAQKPAASGKTLAGTVNDAAEMCPTCHAPSGKKHASTCTRPAEQTPTPAAELYAASDDEPIEAELMSTPEATAPAEAPGDDDPILELQDRRIQSLCATLKRPGLKTFGMTVKEADTTIAALEAEAMR